MLRVLLILVPLALAVYALVDCISTKDDEVKHLPKLVWILLIVLATVVGPLAWIFAGRDRSGAGRGGGGWGGGRRGGGGGGWVAPDDNPEFLRSLEQEREERETEREPERPEPEREADGGDGPAPEDREDREDRQDREEDVRRGEDGGPDDTPPPAR
jgi:hypothetical protein